MPRDDTDIVAAIRTALVDEIGQDRFDLWFGDRVAFSLADGELSVLSSNAFVLGQLQRRLHGELQAAYQRRFGQTVRLRFTLVASSENNDLARGDESDVRSESNGTRDVDSANGRSQSDERRLTEDPSLPFRQSESNARRRPRRASIGSVGAGDESSNAKRGRRFAKLDSLVRGEANKLAATAADMLLEGRCDGLAPLFFHGPPGCGKSHLLEGIYCTARRSGRFQRTVYLSAEQFTNYFLEALRGAGLPSFRRRYRDVDLLLIDDVQFLVGKRSTVVELQHTLDNLLREGRQVVLAADRPPRELNELGADVVARMSGGLNCPIEPHDLAMRLEIVRGMAESRGMQVPDNVLQRIATEISGDARLLSGAMNRLHAASLANDRPVSLALADESLGDLFRASRPVVRLTDIQEAVCEVCGIEPSALKSAGRTKGLSHPRMLAMWLARRFTKSAYSEIGEFFGRRSHSTVVSAQQKVERWICDGTSIRVAAGDSHIDEVVRRIEVRLRKR